MEVSSSMVGLIGMIVLIVLLFFRMHVGFAMVTIGFLGFIYLGGLNPALKVLATVPYRTLADYTISVLPLFIFMGILASNTGIGESLYHSAQDWLGEVRGGLAIATTLACAMFAAISGDSLAGTVTMGKIAVPEMKRYRYDDSLASACVSAGGTLGFLIPPSLGFIFYAILTEGSVGKLFMAGILPGILLTSLFIAIIGIISRINPRLAPAGSKTTFKQKIMSLKHTWAMLCLFLLVMGGIYGGIFTPTEAGAIGAFGAIVISAVGRRLTRRNFLNSLLEAAQTTGFIVAIIIGAFIFMRFLAISELSFMLAELVVATSLNRYVIFALIIVIYIILGMFMDIMACLPLTIPIFFPVILALGFDPIWFGVVVVLVVEMGLITPPIGMNVFVLSGVSGVPVGTIFRGVWPFVAAMLICIIILTFFPQIALFLPSMM